MTDRITLHEDDVETVARHMWEVEEADGAAGIPALCFDDMSAEDKADCLRWTRAACAGATAYACGGIGVAAWTAARGMARALVERMAERDAWRSLAVLLDGRPHERATREEVERARARLRALGLDPYTGERAAEKNR